MKMERRRYWVAIAFVGLLGLNLWGCGDKEPVKPDLPDYLQMPARLSGYKGSGLITLEGGLTLRAEGPEQLDAKTNTYSGVLGDMYTNHEEIIARFTVGQPRPYRESGIVPREYQANGVLMIMNTVKPGTYRMGVRESPGPRGEIADIILNLPGPQVYTCNTGSLTLAEATLIKSEDGNGLYRVKGTFQASLTGSGVGTTPGKPIDTVGTFDLLLLSGS